MSFSAENLHIIVYRVLGRYKPLCNFGYFHEVPVYAEKRLVLIDEVRISDGKGYSDSRKENPIYVDRQGRKYNSYCSVDYYSNVSYQDPNGNWWSSTPPIRGIRVDKVPPSAVS